MPPYSSSLACTRRARDRDAGLSLLAGAFLDAGLSFEAGAFLDAGLSLDRGALVLDAGAFFSFDAGAFLDAGLSFEAGAFLAAGLRFGWCQRAAFPAASWLRAAASPRLA